ncbi:helix-turn-helix domain-containing protein [Desulfogranum mediterraneum]|uniref:helix-turn-helix domain-containing protein n=1 Tax=Desulfogranum mediterraneum TaxID=160661 RepID=UPI0004277043|nr:helix-turn-helix domain-containing protein [Desulfogranum mediterraneum]
MSRPLRIEYPGGWYHVMNQGRRQEEIFLSVQDYHQFITLLQECRDHWKLQVAAYCLMPTHYQLLVHTPDGNLARGMRHLNGIYTQRFNRSHRFDGQLFRGRYKAVLVEEGSYLPEVVRHIHNNPLRAKLAGDLRDFPWSSHQGYLSRAKKWDWLFKESILFRFSPKKSTAKRLYQQFMEKEEPEEINRFYALKNLPSLLGSEAFKEWIREDFAHLRSQKDIPEARLLSPPSARILETICTHFQTSREALSVSRRGQENMARDLALYFLRQYTAETLSSIGSHLKIENYSTVGSAIERAKTRIKKRPDWQAHHGLLRKKLSPGPR